MEQNLAKASKLASLYGGRAYYIPTGDHLKAVLRDRAIWGEFNGRNIDQLACKHSLSVPQTYAVVAEQRQLTLRRVQRELLEFCSGVDKKKISRR